MLNSCLTLMLTNKAIQPTAKSAADFYVEDAEKIFLKTIIPSRKVLEIYLRGKNEN